MQEKNKNHTSIWITNNTFPYNAGFEVLIFATSTKQKISEHIVFYRTFFRNYLTTVNIYIKVTISINCSYKKTQQYSFLCCHTRAEGIFNCLFVLLSSGLSEGGWQYVPGPGVSLITNWKRFSLFWGLLPPLIVFWS